MTKTSVHQRKARDFIQREDWDNALVELERMLGTDGNNPTLHNQIGDVFLRKDEVQRAVEHFETAIDLYAAVGLHNNAVALCKKIMRLRPGRVEIRYRLARLRLDQGFRSEAAAFFREYLEHVSIKDDGEALEKRCREMFELLSGDAPIGLLLEKLEGAQRFVAAFEVVRTLAQQAADAGDDAGAKRFGEKMRSLRVLVERSGGRDLLSEPAPGPARAAAPARATYEPNVVNLGGGSTAPAASMPGVDDPEIDATGVEDAAGAASAAVEHLASTAESVASDVFGAEPLPEMEFELAPGAGAGIDTSMDDAGPAFDFSPGFSLAAEPAVAGDLPHEAAGGVMPEPGREFEIDLTPGFAGFGSDDDFAVETTDEPANSPGTFDVGTVQFDDGELPLPPGVRLIAPVEDVAPLAPVAFEPGDDACAAAGNGAAFDMGFDNDPAGSYFGELAAALEATVADSAVPPPEAFDRPPAPAEPAAPAAAMQRDWAVEQTPNWDPASLAPPPEPVAPVPAAPPVNQWVDELRRSPVWIPTGDTLTEPDPTRPDRGLSMELESVIDSFREQMSRALDGDGSARYDLGVAYYDMGLYNEALAEFEAASKSPGLEVQSYEMLAQCLLQTGRHTEVLELLLPVLAADGHAPRGKVGLQYCLGLACEGLGDLEQARRHYEEVALVDVDFKDIQTRLQRT